MCHSLFVNQTKMENILPEQFWSVDMVYAYLKWDMENVIRNHIEIETKDDTETIVFKNTEQITNIVQPEMPTLEKIHTWNVLPQPGSIEFKMFFQYLINNNK
jgi:hypothetical protein